ncbi:MAG: archease [Candidatus Nanopelagicales bacterium]
MTVPRRTPRPASGASGYRLLPHTADVQLLVWGPSREACLEQVVRAFAATFTRAEAATSREWRSVSIPAGPNEEQLVALIDEVLYLIDVDGQVPVAARVRRLPDGSVTAAFDTVPTTDVRQTGSVPKAASRHALAFARYHSGWRARVTIDV